MNIIYAMESYDADAYASAFEAHLAQFDGKADFTSTLAVSVLMENMLDSIYMPDQSRYQHLYESAAYCIQSMVDRHPKKIGKINWVSVHTKYNEYMMAGSKDKVQGAAYPLGVFLKVFPGYDINTPGAGGITPLMSCSLSSLTLPADLKQLIDLGADVLAASKGNGQAIHMLDIFWPRCGAIDKLPVLLEAGADPDYLIDYQLHDGQVGNVDAVYSSFSHFIHSHADDLYSGTDPEKFMRLDKVREIVAQFKNKNEALSNVSPASSRKNRGAL